MSEVENGPLAKGREELPNGWCISTISEIINKTGIFVDGDWIESKDQDQNGKIRLLQLADIGDGSFIDKSSRFINEEVFSRLKCTETLPGDILVARMPYPLGRACILPFINYRAITVVDVCIIRPNKLYIDAIWLMYFINSNDFRNRIESLSSGTTRKRISRLNLSTIPLPLPPLNEQKRIVAKLDAIMPRIEAVKARLDKVPGILKRFRQSVLTAAVTGKLTEQWREEHPEVGEWEEKKLSSIIPKGNIFDGPFGSNLKTSDYVDGGIRVIRLENIEHMAFIEDKETYITEMKYQTLLRHTVYEGDIIFSSFITENIRACILPALKTKAIAKADCFCLRPDLTTIDAKFLLFALVSFDSYDQLVGHIHGATRPRINTTQLKELVLQLPSTSEQKEIVRQVDKLFALADKVEAHYQKAKARVDKLSQSVLAKAFRGELVPQDPNDEPAEKLLERILEEKAKLEAELKGTRKRGSKK